MTMITNFKYENNYDKLVVLVASGMTHKNIANQLGVSQSTVERWIKRYREETGSLSEENRKELLLSYLSSLDASIKVWQNKIGTRLVKSTNDKDILAYSHAMKELCDMRLNVLKQLGLVSERQEVVVSGDKSLKDILGELKQIYSDREQRRLNPMLELK